jgi:hypothetical protein
MCCWVVEMHTGTYGVLQYMSNVRVQYFTTVRSKGCCQLVTCSFMWITLLQVGHTQIE